MNMNSTNSGAELFKGVLLAHLIIVLHVAVIAVIGLLVIFFGGLARYWAWILLGGLAAVVILAALAYLRIRAGSRRTVRELRGLPDMAGATTEISFLGGLASVKFSRPHPASHLPPAAGPAALLEESETQRIRELAQLAQMVEKNLITAEEFKRAKAAILNPPRRPGFGSARLEN
jgi:hypothetical protein